MCIRDRTSEVEWRIIDATNLASWNLAGVHRRKVRRAEGELVIAHVAHVVTGEVELAVPGKIYVCRRVAARAVGDDQGVVGRQRECRSDRERTRVSLVERWAAVIELDRRTEFSGTDTVSYTHLRAHETGRNLVCR